MSKHRASRYARTKKVLSRASVAAGATAVGLGVLTSPAQAHPTGATTAAAVAPVYTVEPGDTLATIAAAHGQSWQELYELNAVVIGADPDLVFPGQVLVLDGAVQAVAAPAVAAAPGVPATDAVAAAPAVAHITNTAGDVQPHVQAAADAVVTNVSGAAGITIGGTRPSAVDPDGHPAGLALDYMVMSDVALGDAIVQYHLAHWDELGVDYLIWQQQILTSPTGSWEYMEDRGSATANHMDHVHVNYRAA